VSERGMEEEREHGRHEETRRKHGKHGRKRMGR
jgi:hypothetical protein